jgi:hypothetical protein
VAVLCQQNLKTSFRKTLSKWVSKLRLERRTGTLQTLLSIECAALIHGVIPSTRLKQPITAQAQDVCQYKKCSGVYAHNLTIGCECCSKTCVAGIETAGNSRRLSL